MIWTCTVTALTKGGEVVHAAVVRFMPRGVALAFRKIWRTTEHRDEEKRTRKVPATLLEISR